MILAFDIEVYSHDSFVVFKNLNKEIIEIFSTRDERGFVGLKEFITDKTLISYNGYYYDDKILTKMINNWSAKQLKELNDDIIVRKYNVQVNLPCKTLDVFQQIDVSMPSLKKIEGNLGKMILESSVDFNIGRPLTDEEYQEAIEYCCYDTDMVIDICNMRINSYFKPKQALIEMIKDKRNDICPEKAMRWNTTTLSANLLLDKPSVKWADLRLPDVIWDYMPPGTKDLWQTKDKGKVTVEDFDNLTDFGFGGLHGTHKNKKVFKNVKLLDVSSMYPNIILNIKALGTADDVYRRILEERLEIKHKDKIKSDALKLILNSVYGNLNNKYSMLNNPKAALSVCIYGQVALFELAKRLSSSCEIVQSNTDGVAFTTESEVYKVIWKEWEEEFKLTLEEENYKLFIQRDCNNYVAVTLDGKIKTKGGDCNRYSSDQPFKNNSARILDIALVDKLVYGKDVIDTLMENIDKPHLYQYILQAGGTYQGTFDENGKQYQKVNRVFASRKDGVKLFKKRHDDGLVNFPDIPEKMFVWNDEVDKIEDFDKLVDLNHYYQIIRKRLEKWEGV